MLWGVWHGSSPIDLVVLIALGVNSNAIFDADVDGVPDPAVDLENPPCMKTHRLGVK